MRRHRCGSCGKLFGDFKAYQDHQCYEFLHYNKISFVDKLKLIIKIIKS